MTGKHKPKAIRAEAIRRVEQGEEKAVVAKDMGLDYSTLRSWTPHVASQTNWYKQELKSRYLDRVKNGEVPSVVARELGVNPKIAVKWHIRNDEKSTLSQENKEKILRAFEQGGSIEMIAKDLQVSLKRVRQLQRTSQGKESGNRVYSEEEKQQAIQMIESGSNYAEVTRKLGIANLGSVRAWHEAAVKVGNAKPYRGRGNKGEDKAFLWVTRDYPHLDDWRESMADWMAGEKNAIGVKTASLSAFIKQYLDARKLPRTRAEFLKRGLQLEDFYTAACRQSEGGVGQNNHIHDFLDWVLLHHFSDDSEGTPLVSPAFCNPVPWLSSSGLPTTRTSVREVLPYGLICQFRERLAAGPNFRDWTLAQSLMGKTTHDGSNAGNDWFEVTEEKIDKNDPDCVWRIRKFLNPRNGRSKVLEMWSPVRWVVLLIKMQMTARTGQVRMADSGESDTWRYVAGKFIPNTGLLTSKNQGKPWEQGIFRLVVNLQGPATSVLYFNSNKTADIGKDGPDKGQECPWPHLPETSEDPYYWLEKLRNWQEKYNPIKRRVSWAKVPISRGLAAKSDVQNAGYPDTCFLFRTPEVRGEEHLPTSNGSVDTAWQALMAAFESDLAENNRTHEDGSPLLLMDPTKQGRTRYPLHGNRVSLITAFIVDGGIAPDLMMKIVGHCRLIMTLYYTKPGYSHLQNALMGAAEKLDTKKEESIIHWLVSAKAEDMLKRVVFNADNWQTVVEVNPALRNPVGWYLMHDGICLAGGNTTGLDDTKVRGCHNGGYLTKESKLAHGPVQGGIMNCSMCRWKAAEKHHGPALVATLNNQFYHLHLKQEHAVKHASTVSDLKRKKARDEASGTPFGKMKDLKTAERLYEMTMERLAILAASIGGTSKMIQRVQALPDDAGNGMALVAAGDQVTMNTVMEEIDSELLQLCGICGDVEVHPDLDPGKAVYRRSQLFDAALRNHSLPPAFAVMSEEDQLTFGNAFMRNLAHQADPKNPILGLRTVVSIIDQGESLEQILGVKLTSELASAQGQTAKVIPIRLKIESDNGKDERAS